MKWLLSLARTAVFGDTELLSVPRRDGLIGRPLASLANRESTKRAAEPLECFRSARRRTAQRTH